MSHLATQLALLSLLHVVDGFADVRSPPVTPHAPLRSATQTRLARVRCCEPPADDTPPELTKVGSKAYYEGFFTQPVDESVTAERGDGTEQAIKFAASSFVVIAALTAAFVLSNSPPPESFV